MEFTYRLLMLLTMEPHLWESLRQYLHSLPSGLIQNFCYDGHPFDTEYVENPPSQEALIETAKEVAHMIGSIDSLGCIDLTDTPASTAALFFATCSRLERAQLLSSPLEATNVRALFSITTLRQLIIDATNWNFTVSDSETINAFCLGLETSSLEILTINGIVLSPEHCEQVAAAVARCKSLVHFEFDGMEDSIFGQRYCMTLLDNDEIKLERLRLSGVEDVSIDLRGDCGTVLGFDAFISADIDFFLA